MKHIESHRKLWNKGQREFRELLLSFNQHERAIQLFFRQHGTLHSAAVAPSEPWSYEDVLLEDMNEGQIRRIPQNEEHSVAWLIWHMARIEDVAMNMLVAGRSQLLHQDDWLPKMAIASRDTGNDMSQEDVASLSAAIDLDTLRAYRQTVGMRTREIVRKLQPIELKNKVQPSRLEQVMAEGAVVEAARGLIDYWSRRDIAGLLLMPATRHNFVHLNEILRIKQRRE
jgi:hypothetical protein